MGQIEIGGKTYELYPFVEESIARFGYVRAEAAEWLTANLAVAFNRNLGRTIRESGTRITPDERVAMGLQARPVDGHLSYEVWENLTESGRTNPVHCFDSTCARATKRLRTTAQAERHNKISEFFAGVKFRAFDSIYSPCACAIRLDGLIISVPPILPLATCNQEKCGCSWLAVTHREIGRQNNT